MHPIFTNRIFLASTGTVATGLVVFAAYKGYKHFKNKRNQKLAAAVNATSPMYDPQTDKSNTVVFSEISKNIEVLSVAVKASTECINRAMKSSAGFCKQSKADEALPSAHDSVEPAYGTDVSAVMVDQPVASEDGVLMNPSTDTGNDEGADKIPTIDIEPTSPAEFTGERTTTIDPQDIAPQAPTELPTTTVMQNAMHKANASNKQQRRNR